MQWVSIPIVNLQEKAWSTEVTFQSQLPVEHVNVGTGRNHIPMVMTVIFLVMPAYMKTFAETLWPMTHRHPGVIQLIQTLDMNSVIFLFVVMSFFFLSLIYSECSLLFPNVLQYGVRFKLKNSLRKIWHIFHIRFCDMSILRFHLRESRDGGAVD